MHFKQPNKLWDKQLDEISGNTSNYSATAVCIGIPIDCAKTTGWLNIRKISEKSLSQSLLGHLKSISMVHIIQKYVHGMSSEIN